MTVSAAAARLRTVPRDVRDRETERRYAELAERLVPIATELVARVHDEGRESAGQLLASLSDLERHALPVVLAAMVPLEGGVADLLDWVPLPDNARPLRGRALQPCGTHAAFVRHKLRGEPVDEVCREGERRFQRARKRHVRRTGRPATAGRTRQQDRGVRA
jgi:hypothetical protein